MLCAFYVSPDSAGEMFVKKTVSENVISSAVSTIHATRIARNTTEPVAFCNKLHARGCCNIILRQLL